MRRETSFMIPRGNGAQTYISQTFTVLLLCRCTYRSCGLKTLLIMAPRRAPVVWVNGFPGTGKSTVSGILVDLIGRTNAMCFERHKITDAVDKNITPDDPEYHNEQEKFRQSLFQRFVENELCYNVVFIFPGILGSYQNMAC
jgi:hypothetical protein